LLHGASALAAKAAALPPKGALAPWGGPAGLKTSARTATHILKCSPRYTLRTSALFTMSDGVP